MYNSECLRAQTILYKNDIPSLEKSISSIYNSVRVCKNDIPFNKVEICLGDASPSSIINDKLLEDWNKKYSEYVNIKYTFFNLNSGTSKGQNILFKDCIYEYLMLYNPDIVVSPLYFTEMMKPFKKYSNVGMVESRQVPLEHPKSFDFNDGTELWGAMACVIVPSEVYKETGGLDEKNFFMYCDDVDFSWRLRLSGRKVIYQSNATVFHGHRLDKNGNCVPTEAELYYSAESALLLAYKWSNDKRLKEVINVCSVGTSYQQKALKEFYRRKEEGLLTERLDKEHKISYFKNGCYSKNRY